MAAGQYKRSIVWKPQPKQAAFMQRCEDEALYGGAADGGKSDALVIESLYSIPGMGGLLVDVVKKQEIGRASCRERV